MYDFLVSLFDGVDLDRYEFLIPMLISVIIVLCLGVTFRALLTIFNIFWGR